MGGGVVSKLLVWQIPDGQFSLAHPCRVCLCRHSSDPEHVGCDYCIVLHTSSKQLRTIRASSFTTAPGVL
jgi:hypothetical protein